ncbi:MAG: hypothetical protein K1X67_19180 [Fimbriimonadaceae bacterium]|nr:hypothetical protein [Fimbriimonadaceae bacterium]
MRTENMSERMSRIMTKLTPIRRESIAEQINRQNNPQNQMDMRIDNEHTKSTDHVARKDKTAELAGDAFSGLTEKGKTTVSIEAEVANGRYSKLNVTISNLGQIFKKSVDVPTWEFFRLERAVIQRRMAKIFDGIPNDSPIFLTSLPPGLSSSDLLPGRVSVRTFDNSVRFVEDHLLNIEHLRFGKLRAETTRFFNFVAPPPNKNQVRNSRWTVLRNQYDRVAETLGIQFGSDKIDLLNTLAEGDNDIVVVVAHGDQSAIYLPDGSTLTAKDVLDLPAVTSKRPPIVVLLSCETGTINASGAKTIAQALMLRGRASAVIAPTRQVPAGQRTAEILSRIVQSAEEGGFSKFLKELRGPWQVIVHDKGRSAKFGYG